MHIMEGYLPMEWCIVWFVLSIPFIIVGLWQMKKLIDKDQKVLPLMAVCGAFVFVLSALKIPSVTGSCSHPTGTGLSASFFGPFVTAVLGTIVLIFQALLLAHGGLTTLGANICSMGIIGPAAGFIVWRLLVKGGVGLAISLAITAFLADWVT